MLSSFMRKFILTLAFIFILTPFAFAEVSMSLGGISIKLGDQKLQIFPKIERSYRVIEFEPDCFAIFEKEELHQLGTISFKNDKVIRITRRWGDFSKTEGLQIVKALIGIISSLPKDENVAYISVSRNIIPKLTLDEVKLSFGIREISITLFDHKDEISIIIDEALSQKK